MWRMFHRQQAVKTTPPKPAKTSASRKPAKKQAIRNLEMYNHQCIHHGFFPSKMLLYISLMEI
jgi:hypothetical protein